MYKGLIIFGSIALLCACTGVSKQDSRALASITSVNNHVSVKRQRQFVISPASSIGLVIKGSPSEHKHILESFKYYFRHVELIDGDDGSYDRYDFVFKISLLKIQLTSEKKKPVVAALKIVETSEAGKTSAQKPKKATKKKYLKPIRIKPLRVVMSISMLDAISGQIVDVATVDAYSSAIRKPKNKDFVKGAINDYIETLSVI